MVLGYFILEKTWKNNYTGQSTHTWITSMKKSCLKPVGTSRHQEILWPGGQCFLHPLQDSTTQLGKPGFTLRITGPGDQASRRGGQSAEHEGIQQLEAFVCIVTGVLKGFRNCDKGTSCQKGLSWIIKGWNSDLKKICETDSSSPSSCRLQSFTTSASRQWNSPAKILNKPCRMLVFPDSASRKL